MAPVVDNRTPKRHKVVDILLSWHPDIRTILLSSIVGVIGGFGAIVFRFFIRSVNNLLVILPSQLLDGQSVLITILAPTVGGLIVGAIVHYFAAEARGHGVPEIIGAVNLNDGKMRLRVPFAKIIASAITIGSTGSAGREGPIAQIGGGFGSLISRIFQLDAEESKTMVISGVSAGISATFNAPLGGILFGYEIIRRDRKAVNVLPLIVASVVGTAISEYYLKDIKIFNFPTNTSYQGILDIPIFIMIGILLGFVSIGWIVGFYFIEDIFLKLKFSPVLVTGLGGFLIGVMQIWYPEVSGISYAPINQAFALELSLGAVLILAVMKFLATSITLGSGASGGVFAPTLFIGTMLGTAIGYILVGVGLSTLPIPFFAVLGMAALFAGSARAPLTAVIMISEMTGDFQLFIPLMFVVAISWLISKRFYKSDIYIVKLQRRGIEFGYNEDILENIQVKDIMISDIVSVAPKDRIEHVIELMKETGHTGYPVVEDGILRGIITEHDVDRTLDREDIKTWIVSEHCTSEVVSVVKDCPLGVAFVKMAELGINRFPVIEDKESHELVGWITRSDVMRAYRMNKKLKVQKEYDSKMFEHIKP